MNEELYQQEVEKETVRLMRLQVRTEEAMSMVKYYRKNGIKDLQDNITIDACQKIIKLETEKISSL